MEPRLNVLMILEILPQRMQ